MKHNSVATSRFTSWSDGMLRHTHTHTEVLIVQVCVAQWKACSIYISNELSKKTKFFIFLLKPVYDGHLASTLIGSSEESRASKNKPVIADCTSRTDIKQPQDFFFYGFWQWWRTQLKKTKKQSSFIPYLHKKAPFFVLWCVLMSVLYIPGQPTYIVVVFNGVLRFLSPPWYSIGTVLDNVKDTKNNK